MGINFYSVTEALLPHIHTLQVLREINPRSTLVDLRKFACFCLG